MQSILRKIPQDGTFDQVKPILALNDKLLKIEEGRPHFENKVWIPGTVPSVYSFDLSAATDRLPVSLQELLLQPRLGEKLADSWRRLLVERDYRLKIVKNKESKTLDLRYSVGQPMGALSSWVLLAITHHFIVQFAHYLVCKDEKRG